LLAYSYAWTLANMSVDVSMRWVSHNKWAISAKTLPSYTLAIEFPQRHSVDKIALSIEYDYVLHCLLVKFDKSFNYSLVSLAIVFYDSLVPLLVFSLNCEDVNSFS